MKNNKSKIPNVNPITIEIFMKGLMEQYQKYASQNLNKESTKDSNLIEMIKSLCPNMKGLNEMEEELKKLPNEGRWFLEGYLLGGYTTVYLLHAQEEIDNLEQIYKKKG